MIFWVFKDIRRIRPQFAPGYLVFSSIFLVEMYFPEIFGAAELCQGIFCLVRCIPTLFMKISRITYGVIECPIRVFWGRSIPVCAPDRIVCSFISYLRNKLKSVVWRFKFPTPGYICIISKTLYSSFKKMWSMR